MPDRSHVSCVGSSALGGLRLHEWHWAADEPGHDADAAMRDDLLQQRDAYVMGRNMFGPIRGEWDSEWRGWWGEEPPYHAPVYVLTHHPHESSRCRAAPSSTSSPMVSRRPTDGRPVVSTPRATTSATAYPADRKLFRDVDNSETVP